MLSLIQQQLQKAISLHQSGNTDEAINICLNNLKKNPNEPNILQLLGAFKKARGEVAEAEKYLKASLAANSRQPHVHNNLGNLYIEVENFAAAETCYQKATDLEPRYADAWFNWSVVLEKQKKHAESIARVRKAIECDPKQAKYYNQLGLCYKRLQDYPAAIEAFEKSIRIQPGYLQGIHNLGTAYREEERYDEARNCFNYVLNNKADQVETWEALGSLYHSTEDFDRSIIAYGKLLDLEPENLKIHRVLNNMMWETGRHEGFLGSYLKALKARPSSDRLIAAYAEELALGMAFDEAVALLEEAMERQGETPRLLHRLANIRKKTGDMNAARQILEKILQQVTDNDEYYTEYAQVLLELGEYEDALRQAALAERINPDYQKLWAIKGDCWRLLGDDRYHWLYDFDRLVRPMAIETPEGFRSVDAFNEALAEELTKLHINDINPRDQTLLGGTQTVGDLYKNRNPMIQKLKKAVHDAAIRYISELPDDDSHPHLRRKTNRIKYAGAWSVRLQSAGFHVDHYHPKGWISGPYYVKIPTIVRDSTEEGAWPGWVKFGASRYGPEKDRVAQRIIKPEAGLQVFFPSYTWHGTNPFEADEIRMTAPCDIIPL